MHPRCILQTHVSTLRSFPNFRLVRASRWCRTRSCAMHCYLCSTLSLDHSLRVKPTRVWPASYLNYTVNTQALVLSAHPSQSLTIAIQSLKHNSVIRTLILSSLPSSQHRSNLGVVCQFHLHLKAWTYLHVLVHHRSFSRKAIRLLSHHKSTKISARDLCDRAATKSVALERLWRFQKRTVYTREILCENPLPGPTLVALKVGRALTWVNCLTLFSFHLRYQTAKMKAEMNPPFTRLAIHKILRILEARVPKIGAHLLAVAFHSSPVRLGWTLNMCRNSLTHLRFKCDCLRDINFPDCQDATRGWHAILMMFPASDSKCNRLWVICMWWRFICTTSTRNEWKLEMCKSSRRINVLNGYLLQLVETNVHFLCIHEA